MPASRQPQAFAFLWIPLTSVTPRILLQTSNGDFPGSCNQNLPGDQIILESSLIPGTRGETGFSYPHSCCLAWTLAWTSQEGGAPKDASRNTNALTFNTVTGPPWRPQGSFEASSCTCTKADCRHSDTLGQTHSDEWLIFLI